MGDAESCNIRVLNSGWNHVNHIIKVEAYNEVVSRLKELNVPEVFLPGFEDELWMHFNRLPIRYVRYALDMKVDRAKDILMHKRLLHMAGASPFAIAPAVEVNLVQVHSASGVHCSNSLHSISQREITSQDSDIPGMRHGFVKIYTFLTSLLSETGLDIQEAHAFSTLDGYSLDVFVVSGWALEETEKLKHVLTSKIHKLEHWLKESSVPIKKLEKTGINFKHENLSIGGNNAWEIDASCLRYVKKIASGSFSDVYKGTYCNQDVAIKVLKNGNLNENIQREFSREVYILRKIKHKNVIELIGACTIPSSLYIVTEYMSGGSMYDFLHIQKAVLTLSSLLKVAIDVSEGLHCLHNHGIIHRDLKSANLLMDGKGVVKIADFGVARLLDPTGIMTAETGTYRWMAPELPYEHLSPLQAAVGVVQKGLRPEIPRDTHPKLVELLHQCWQQDPSVRPDFSEILKFLQHFRNMVEGKRKVKAKIMHEKE
ncbi:hypothetical protein TanjilG_29412 [Lupinus angustifolius]|uniref:non-specific serine/threonine protein kinase n=1 Tax=Lupinus angustifolius TaxID=3871 RepID=A0A1J7GXJ1_LUPAN|nr:hypothetical protein TanjilG_29412 [Lupinus angustifolius]